MRKTNFIPPLLAGLAILVLFSCVMLSGQLLPTAEQIPSTTISVSVPKSMDAPQQAPLQAVTLRSTPVLLANPGSSIHDNKQTWDTDTEVDIFMAQYDNASGEITVQSPYGDKLIAPGTANDYDFFIENTGDVSLDFSLKAEGTAIYVKDDVTYVIPIQAKLSDSDGNYLLGTADGWASLASMENVTDSGTIASGNHIQYTLRWQWPFEQTDVDAGDQLDTLLGDLAAAGDLVQVKVKLSVTVSANDDPNAPGGEPPYTGDSQTVGLWMTMAILSFAAFLILLVQVRKERRNEN